MTSPAKRKKAKPSPSKGRKNGPSLHFLKTCSNSAHPDWGPPIAEFKVAGRNGHAVKP